MRKTVLFAFLLALFLTLPPIEAARANEVRILEVSQKGEEIFVSARLALDEGLVREIKAGVEKKLIFHVDLFRPWHGWADEFILGKKIERNIRCDNVKGEYIVEGSEGGRHNADKRFENCDGLLGYALSIHELRLAHTGEFVRSRYYVKLTAESRLRNFPPLVGQMFFFIKDKEFSVETKSPQMRMGTAK